MSKQLHQDFFGQTDSIFYKKCLLKKKDITFHKENMFFYDSFKYDNLNLDFLNYQSAPSVGTFDFFSLKPFSFSKKAKAMNFKILLENDMLAFEKFYLRNNLFYVDSFDYLQRSTYNLNDLISSVGYNHGGPKPFILSKLLQEESQAAFTARFDREERMRKGFPPFTEEVLTNYKKSQMHFNKKFKKYGAFDHKLLQGNPLLATDASLKHLDNLLFAEGFKKEDFFAKAAYISGLPKFSYKGFPINPSFINQIHLILIKIIVSILFITVSFRDLKIFFLEELMILMRFYIIPFA